ncbi:MAG: hypothetical protein ACREUX_05655 [Burkholderiales bacterium]
MSTKYDDDIREAESRLVRDRQALVAQAEDLTARTRDVASSPKGLVAAFAVGFVLGELTRPRRPRRSKSQAQTADTTAKVGLGGLIGSALFAYARSRYGSPWALGHSAWSYYAARQQARRAATQGRTPAATTNATGSTVVRPARTPAGDVGAVSPAAAYSSSLRSPQQHAG